MNATVIAAPVRTPVHTPIPNVCANCETPRMGEYCYACGQHFLEGRLTIGRLARDFIVRKLGLEGGLLRTASELTMRPHTMIRQYVDGRRQRYTNPVAYLLLMAALYVLLSGMWTPAMEAGFRSELGEEGAEMEAMVQVQLWMDGHPALSTMILCLFVVPALSLLFRRTTTTAEASVFALYVSGHLLLMQAVINVAAVALSADVYRMMTGRITGIAILVLLFSAGRFFGTRFTSYLKVAVALAISAFGVFVLMVVAAVVLAALAAAAPAASL
ncbi:MAG TPA: DUF3667 domain-containing protein [Longimicrobium sp.]|nr:DUF3667 domain-containing protein [Longimicrobium sp.]